jgi:voltage-gated potassium channel Kch
VSVAIDGLESAKRVVKTARDLYLGIPFIDRARELREATDLVRLGVTKAVADVVEASLQLRDAVLLGIGVLKKNVEKILGMMGQDNYSAVGVSQGGET